MRRHSYGITLVELLVVLSIVVMVLVAVLTLSMQSMRLFAKYQPLVMGQSPNNTAPQAAMMLGMKRMERGLREAMFIRVGSSSTAVETALPKTDADGNILLRFAVIDAQTQRQALICTEGRHVCYFLGRKDPLQPGRAIPDPIAGDTIFSVVSGAPTETGSDIINSSGNLAAYYDNAEIIIAGITMVSYLFSYLSSDAASSITDSMNTRVVRINLTYPITMKTRSGWETKNQVLKTQFYLRNFETL